jgi:hypothetical protein
MEFLTQPIERGMPKDSDYHKNTQSMVNKETFRKATYCNAKFRLVYRLFVKSGSENKTSEQES